MPVHQKRPWQHLYGHRWRQRRAQFLRLHPLCVICERHGRLSAARVVDHVIPHRGDEQLFWDESNWQSLCKTCHDAIKQAEEHGRGQRGCDAGGAPFDTNHHWNS